MYKILIGLPVFGDVPPETLQYLIGMRAGNDIKKQQLALCLVPRATIVQARNAICDEFVNDTSYTHLLWFDDDQFPTDDNALDKLLKYIESGKDTIVSGLTRARDESHYLIYEQN
jgi:hypothetical protein